VYIHNFIPYIMLLPHDTIGHKLLTFSTPKTIVIIVTLNSKFLICINNMAINLELIRQLNRICMVKYLYIH